MASASTPCADGASLKVVDLEGHLPHPEARSSRRAFACRSACANWDREALRRASTGAESAADNFGKTPLHYAAREGFVQGLLDLLEQGVDPNVEDLHCGRAIDEAMHGATKAKSKNRREACLQCRDLLLKWQGEDACAASQASSTNPSSARPASLEDHSTNSGATGADANAASTVEQSSLANTASSAEPGSPASATKSDACRWGDVVEWYRNKILEEQRNPKPRSPLPCKCEPLDPKHEVFYL